MKSIYIYIHTHTHTTIFPVAEDWNIPNPQRQEYFEQYRSPILKSHYSIAKLGYVKEDSRRKFYDLCVSNKPNSPSDGGVALLLQRKHSKI
jgi:hypothetical protein